MVWDIKILYLLNGLTGKSAVFDKVIIFFGGYLEFLLVALFLVGLYFGRIIKSEKKKVFWVGVLSPIIARLGVTELIRFFYHRSRPFVVFGDIRPLLAENEWSFPSGHAAFFFALAMAIYFFNKRWGAWFFIGAILISLGRIVAGIHYPSDILGGAIVGIGVGYFVFNYADVFFKKGTRAS